MALVLLPCDLPIWNKLKKHFKQIGEIRNRNFQALVIEMKIIYHLCNFSLDPDDLDRKIDPEFEKLENFFLNDFNDSEKENFWNKILPQLIESAEKLPEVKPISGLYYSLQQQNNSIRISKDFVASLLSNCFFCTFPKRTQKTFPTLQDFNLTHFFKNLDQPYQKIKLKSILNYFMEIKHQSENMIISRYVFEKQNYQNQLLFSDWENLTCDLCPVEITLKTCQQYIKEQSQQSMNFCHSVRIFGENLLNEAPFDHFNYIFITCPELLACLLFVEILKANEVLIVDNVNCICKITDFDTYKSQAEFFDQPKKVNIRFMVSSNDISNKDDLLNDLNKYLLVFQQGCCNNFINNNSIKFDQQLSYFDDIDEECFTNSDEFHTANSTLNNSCDEINDLEADENFYRRYSQHLSSIDRRISFAQRLRDILSNQSSYVTNSTDESNYAVGITVTGSEVNDKTIKLHRKGSTGFILNENSINFNTDYCLSNSMSFIDNFDFGLNDKNIPQIYGNLLRRTLSESYMEHKMKLNLDAKSLSLGVENQQSINDTLLNKYQYEQKIIRGYYEDKCDVQLQIMVEWIAASAAGVPLLVYSTYGTKKLNLATTVTCSLLDKHCTISDLFSLIVKYIEQRDNINNHNLFDTLMKFNTKNAILLNSINREINKNN